MDYFSRAACNGRKHYIDVQRREEGFDLSDSKNRLGEFTSTKGVRVICIGYKISSISTICVPFVASFAAI